MAKKIVLHVCRKDGTGKPWTEDYIRDIPDNEVSAWGKVLIANFNETLRPGEKTRRFIKAEIIGETANPKHRWSKTSLTTQNFRGRHADLMKCEVCGITGKRFTLGEFVKIDSAFKARAFIRCDTAVEFIRKKRVSE